MMLRLWQSQCIKQALDKYSNSMPHFFCQATPGAGKTMMAAELARSLLTQNKIDLVLCFSPSLVVAQGIKETFSRQLKCSFSGGLGTKGASYTYQSIRFLNDDFWHVLSNYRILVVFDEIHHCAFDESGESNVWGEQIVSKIQRLATYTLALSGTPWRSDNSAIVMTEYSDPEGEVICDYQYSLQQAINDEVCRSPKIVLIDNDNLTVRSGENNECYGSIFELLKQSKTSYRSVIHNEDAIDYILASGCEKLAEIRTQSDNAAGLIVASSVQHAKYLQRKLLSKFNQTVELVTYHDDDPLRIIDEFRHSKSQWIVSVGMISEGTDIPRLQVCCHLSSVKTELNFRQVLGRILRANKAPNQEAWLFTFAEENLIGFAERIEQDIPETCLYVHRTSGQRDHDSLSKSSNIAPNVNSTKLSWGSGEILDTKRKGYSSELERTVFQDELRLGMFKQRVISAFI